MSQTVEYQTCKYDPKDPGFCESMDERLSDSPNSRAKGLTMIVSTSLKNGGRKYHGVAYNMGGRDPGLMLNVCPWCAKPLMEHPDASDSSDN